MAVPNAASHLDFVVDPEHPDAEPFYAPSKRNYPQAVKGFYRSIKWAALVATLATYYLLPFVRWNRGPGAPGQAVLLDLADRRFYFFFVEIWPQEAYYVAGLLVLAALVLFMMNALAGRVWCGYLCPQTVWTDLFFAVERRFEGDLHARRAREAKGWTFDRAWRLVAKHATWVLIAWWTGGAWVLYFSDAPTLVRALATLQAPAIAYVWIGILTFTTYALAGHMREQVCVYMCPWPRIQAALTDEWALNVTYRTDRGEPRLSLKKSHAARSRGEPAGDCVDCRQCVAVCPTGVDIRDGLQLGCIQCGLCIDACDAVMSKVGRPARLIAYDTDMNVARRAEGKPALRRLVRPRTILYAVAIAAVGSLMLWRLTTRPGGALAIAHDRNPLSVTLADGSIQNGYSALVINRDAAPRTFDLSASGVPGAKLVVEGAPSDGTRVRIQVPGDDTREVRVLLRAAAPSGAATSVPVTFTVVNETSGETATATDRFETPAAN
ncbi:MAG: cytochrome c oxidase accessory protein CcoG [Hyphomicrobiales bacterium]|nr:cytochrome c oxidase accessory protein CcoG [Hyphomicrobiales bacterium]MDE2016412.1 cytochrome c oxidase accessory protein CcoG [Hyphomicrobiales bacterium]